MANNIIFNLKEISVGADIDGCSSPLFSSLSDANSFTFPSLTDFVQSIVLPQGESLVLNVDDWSYQRFSVIKDNAIYYQEDIDLNASGNLIRTIQETTGQIITTDLGKPPEITYLIPSHTLTNIPSGSYNIVYQWVNGRGSLLRFSTDGLVVSFVENRYPLKKWTITEVLNKIADTIEPLRYGEKPRFRLDGVLYDEATGCADGYVAGSQAEDFDRIIAPEFAFTKMTLREMWKIIGGFIHGEARITNVFFDKGRTCFEYRFDKYGGIKKSNIKNKPYVSAGFKADINDYCTGLDSSAENLVNQLDWASGVIVEPFVNGEKTLRTENITVRMAEDNSTVIETKENIQAVYKLEYLDDLGTHPTNKYYNIEPYVFEKVDYDLLSSYQGTYPFAKCYAIYYTQGQKNIKGLFLKTPHAVSTAFRNYSIINILKAVTGHEMGITGQDLMKMEFRITYLPIYSTRVKTNKQTIINGLPRTIAYNQSANLIESRYYGENLKGVVARLGNIEKTYTYNLAFLSDVPTAGDMFDENYYITSVSTEILPSYIRCTLGLSKDFNRQSEYVGISSNKHMWEVSERQSYSRDTVLTDYVVITEDSNIIDDTNTLFDNRDNKIAEKIIKNNLVGKPVSTMVFETKTKKMTTLKQASLPVVATALGNSMLFSTKFADNYSVGERSTFVTGEDNISGYWGEYIPYGDYYGRFYYLAIMYLSYNKIEIGNSPSTPFTYPDTTAHGNANVINGVSAYNEHRLIKYRKDSREIPAITYELQFVTDNPSLIIGSALAKNCGFVNTKPDKYKLYTFKERLNNVSSKVDYSTINNVIGDLTTQLVIENDHITLPTITGDYEAWAIITEPTFETIIVEDEDGDKTTQIIQKGSELILGQNEKLNGQTYYLKVKRSIYK